MNNWIEEIRNFIFQQCVFTICPIFLSLLCTNSVVIVFGIQRYLVSKHLPENRPATLLERWWSGLMLSGSVLYQFCFILLFCLPFFIGLSLVILAELYYLYIPDSISLAFGTPQGIIPFFLIVGIVHLIFGVVLSKLKFKFMLRTEGIFKLVNQLDAYSLIVLAIISLYVTVQAVFFIHPDPMSCLTISLPVAIISAGVAFWWLTDLEIV